MKKFLFTSSVLFFILLEPLCSHAIGGDPDSQKTPSDWRAVQDVHWNNAELIKAAIVSNHKLLLLDPKLEMDQTFNEHSADVAELLLVLDPDVSEPGLEVIGSLASYRLNSAEDEIYACLVQRKGSRIVPILRRLLESQSSECIEKYSDSRKSKNQETSSICRSEVSYRDNIRRLLRLISVDAPCTYD
jgi:hypothetical protein